MLHLRGEHDENLITVKNLSSCYKRLPRFFFLLLFFFSIEIPKR